MPKSLAAPRVRLICFAHAGAGASTFQPWAQPLAEQGVEVRAAQYPGRENRWGEPLLRSVDEMVAHWADHWLELAGDDGVPVACYGHSMGVLIVHALARRLRGEGREVRQLILGGRNPPHVPSVHPPIHHLADDAFLTAVGERYGNLPAVLLADPEMRELILPVLKADFQLVDEYRGGVPDDPLNIPFSILNGADDPFVSEEVLPDWQRYTEGRCRWERLAGGHFFHQKNREAVLRSVALALAGIGR